MTYEESIKEGWDFTAKSSGTVFAASDSSNTVAAVQNELTKFKDELLDEFAARRNMGTAQLAGNSAEIFHAGTFNVNAALRGSENRAERLGVNGFASVDIHLKSGEDFSSKYIKSAVESADAQKINIIESYYKHYLPRAKRNTTKAPETFEEYCANRGFDVNDAWKLRQSVYSGQGKIIPSDQLDAAMAYIDMLKEIERGKPGENRAALFQSYSETLATLSDRIKDADGIESIPLSKEQAEVLAKMGQDDSLDLSQFGITLEKLISNKYILQQSLKAGYTSAITTLVMQIAPEVYKAIDYLIKNGEIDIKQLRDTGLTVISASAEGFIRGAVSSALTYSYLSGRMGNVLDSVSQTALPGIIGSITVVVMDTIKDSVKVATGKLSYEEMAEHLIKDILVTFAGVAVGSLVQALLSGAPALGYMLGSFVGSAVAGLLFEASEKAIISFCISTGFSFFGLVNQDYTLPEELMADMGFDSFDFEGFEMDSFDFESFEFESFEFETFEFETIDIKILKRGMVAVSTVGYMLE